MFYEGLFLYLKTGVNTARTLYIKEQKVKNTTRFLLSLELALIRIPSLLYLKGQRHEINNFFEGLKNQISSFCISADVFKFFASILFRKIRFKVLLLL